MDNTLTTELQQRLAELQALFHAQLPGKIDEIRVCWESLRQEWNPEQLGKLHRLSHSLAGSGGTFSAHEVSATARDLEQYIKNLSACNTPPNEASMENLENLLNTLTNCAMQWKPLQAPMAVHEEDEPTQLLNTVDNLIYLVEDDALVAQQYQGTLQENGYQVEHFATTEAFKTACQQVLPSIVIMDMVFAEGKSAGANVIKELKGHNGSCPNTIFVSQRNDIEARLAALRAGALRYLTKPVDLDKLLLCVDQLNGRQESHPYRVLIIDDDDTLAQYHSELLESQGIETHIINNPMMALEVIEEYRPELILLDIYMGGCSGTELAAVIRQDDKLAHMPIVFLSEELDMDYQIAALHLGGDEFITKPVNPDNFIDMVTARLSRSRTINDLNRQLRHTMRELNYQQLAIDEHSIVSIANPDGTITYVNEKFCEVSKYSRDELLGKNHRIVKSDHHPKSFFDEMWSTITAGKVWHGVVKNRAKDGRHYWVDSTIVPFLDKQGLPYKYISVRTDITQVIEAQQQMEIARDEAQEASRAKSQFLSSMSHELRTPMNAILGFAQLLEMEPLENEQHHWVKDILKGGNHLLSLINDTLDLAKIESGQVELSLEPVVVKEVINESTTLLQPVFNSRSIQWSLCDCDERVIKTDRTRFKQVVINLLSNATKYNHEGGSITVKCSSSQHEESLRISISDTGPGIATERIPELFEPFNRLDNEGGAIEGSGIGLTICKDLIEMMGGEIGVDSEPGHGSTFWLELPLTTLPKTDTTNRLSDTASSAVGEERNYKVLYIEDNPVNLRLVSMVMSKQSHIDLHTAHEPVLGLEIAHNDLPDLILLDINLPGMNGYEVLSRLRADEATAHIPVIAVSANALEDDLSKGKDSGFNDYVTKPINIKQFTETVNQTLKNT